MNESIPTRSVAETLGFPPGYFSIRSLATGKLWDIHGNFDADGTMVYLWREKEKSLVEDLRDPNADNQMFFIDYTGALCSKASGHAIDVQDGRIVLRRHRPMTLPFPNAYSHPLPRFAYDSSTGNIHVRFSSDPSYPPPPPAPSPSLTAPSTPSTDQPSTSKPNSQYPSTAWRERQYLVSSIPKRKPPSALDHAAQFFSNAVSVIVPSTPVAPTEEEHGEYDLRDYEIVEEERPAESEVDDSPDIHRDICVLSLPLFSQNGTEMETLGGGSSKARERRRWEILPITRGKATFRSPTHTQFIPSLTKSSKK